MTRKEDHLLKRLAAALLVLAAFLSAQTKINQIVLTNSGWDQFTTSKTYQPQIEQQLSGIITYTPFFDAQLSWFTKPAFAYTDSYAIYTDPTRNGPIINAHPEWVLHDASGNKLYIPWGCSAGTCPQYAADIGNPKYVQYMTGGILSTDSPGYGLFFDDVNTNLQRVADVNGNQVAPIDPRTNTAMTEAAWESYFGTYTAALRAAARTVNPNYQVIHNAIWWFEGTASPGIDQEIKSADYVGYERGFGDPGLTGGTGFWSLSNFMASIDRIHGLGSHVALFEYNGTATFQYSVACYFLITDGRDTTGFTDLTPDKWDANTTRLMNVDLGTPLGPRHREDGLLERDFSKGYVLVAEPGAGPFTLVPDKAIINAYTGQPVTSIALTPQSGGVFLYQ